jgi:hypothetical protein
MKRWSVTAQAWPLLPLLVALAPDWAMAADEFAGRIRAARHLIECQRYPRALEELARAKPLAGEVPLRGMVLALHAGVAFAQQGDTEQALTAFRAALSEDLQARLPLAVSPRLAREFEELRLRVSREPGPPASDAPRVRARETLLSTWVKDFPRSPPPPPPVDLSVRVLRPRVAVPATASVGLAASGVVFWTLARREQTRLIRNDPPPRDAGELESILSRARTYRAIELSLFGASAVALGVAITQYVRREPDPREERPQGLPSANPLFSPLEGCS